MKFEFSIIYTWKFRNFTVNLICLSRSLCHPSSSHLSILLTSSVGFELQRVANKWVCSIYAWNHPHFLPVVQVTAQELIGEVRKEGHDGCHHHWGSRVKAQNHSHFLDRTTRTGSLVQCWRTTEDWLQHFYSTWTLLWPLTHFVFFLLLLFKAMWFGTVPSPSYNH